MSIMALLCYTFIFVILYNQIFLLDVNGVGLNISEIGDFMDNFCPYNVICRTGRPKKETYIPGVEGCCTVCRVQIVWLALFIFREFPDCSCEDTCGLTENCCFPSLDIHNVVDRSHQKCTTSSPLPDSLDHLHSIAYNMVVDEYPNGKGIHCGDNVTKCGDNEKATPIGSHYPVFSKRTGRIYKNIECAKCHRVREDEAIKWKVWLTCAKEEYYEYTDIFPSDVMSYLYGIETGNLPKRCVYQFEYPGPKSDIKTEQCIGYPVSSCSDNFNLLGMNMTRNEIRDQCTKGVYSPFMIRFRNIFCYICSSDFWGGKDLDSMCKIEDDSSRLKGVSFAALLDPESIENRIYTNTPAMNKREACSSHKDTASPSCREVYCPTGQVVHDNGKCVYTSKQWGNTVFSLNIKLIPKVDFLNESIVFTDKINFEAMLSNQTLSPWPTSWKSKLFLYTTENKDDGEKIIDHFLVKIVITKQTTDIAPFLKSIQKILHKDWYLYMNEFLVANKQVLSELTYFKINASTTQIKHIQPPHKYEDGNARSTPIYTELMYINSLHSLAITKLFFCQQIQLLSEEFEIDGPSKTLYYVPENKILFLGEFYVVRKDKNSSLARICIEDSPYKLPKEMELATSSAKLSESVMFSLGVVATLHILSN